MPSDRPVNKPNFFILGAAKSGTTSLHYYLRQHPEIFMSTPKEPTFYCEHFQVVRNPIDYHRLFDGVTDETAIGESSHAYLTSPTTPGVIRALYPDARFVAIFRHPADRAYSLYQHMRRYGHERAETFERALEIEDQRVDSLEYKKTCTENFYNYLYFRSGLYSEQVQRYLDLYDRRRFHFLTLKQLKQDPHAAIGGVLRFLGVSADFEPDLEVQNQAECTPRSARVDYYISRHLHKIPPRVRRLGRRLYHTLYQKYGVIEVPPLREDTRRQLVERYRDE
ncbi:MAG: sulfotransferase family protein, partial [Planctomycetota bacterium]